MYLGLDIGTSGVKGVLINEHQDIRAEATAPLSVSRPHKGWSEQDPETWKTAVDSVIPTAFNIDRYGPIFAFRLM